MRAREQAFEGSSAGSIRRAFGDTHERRQLVAVLNGNL
jgi:hypothetical protein